MGRPSRLNANPLIISDYDDEQQAALRRGGGMCEKFTASICSLMGIAVLVVSYLLLRSDGLQMQKYWDLRSNLYNKPFPAVLLGCAATNIASGLLQIISSLMLLYKVVPLEISLKDMIISIWRWLNFTTLMITIISILLLIKEDYSDVALHHIFLNILIGNSVICGLLLTWNVLCMKSSNK